MSLKVKDIAGILGISPATVSLVLNNKPGISEETRQKVLKLVEDMGYGTNLLSKPALKNNRNIRFVIYKKHGLVVSDTPFFSTLMEGIDQEAREGGYNLLVSYVNEKENSKMEILRHMEDHRPDGILLLATEMQVEDLLPFRQLGIPMVVLDHSFPTEKVDSVAIRNEAGVYEAVKYLVDNGHHEIGYLKSSVWIHNFEERKNGFIKAITDHGMKPQKKWIFELESTMEGAYRDMCRVLASKPALPSGLFADNDLIAFGAMKALKEFGYGIPEDVSVIGFDDMPFCEMAEPALTTVKVYNRRMGRIAVKRLMEKIQSSVEEFIKIVVGTDLILRKSVRHSS